MAGIAKPTPQAEGDHSDDADDDCDDNDDDDDDGSDDIDHVDDEAYATSTVSLPSTQLPSSTTSSVVLHRSFGFDRRPLDASLAQTHNPIQLMQLPSRHREDERSSLAFSGESDPTSHSQSRDEAYHQSDGRKQNINLSSTAPARSNSLELDGDSHPLSLAAVNNNVDESLESPPNASVDPCSPDAAAVSLAAVQLSESNNSLMQTAIFTPSASIGLPPTTQKSVASLLANESSSTTATVASSPSCCALCESSHGTLLDGAKGLRYHATCLAPPTSISASSQSTPPHAEPNAASSYVAPSPQDTHLHSEIEYLRRSLKSEVDERLLKEATDIYERQQKSPTGLLPSHYDKDVDTDASGVGSPSISNLTSPISHTSAHSRAYPYNSPPPGALSCAPVITPIVEPSKALYPAASSNYSFPLLANSLQPLSSPMADNPHPIVFGTTFPSTSLTGRMAADPTPQPVFAKGSTGYVAPPSWGSQSYRPRCDGDAQDELTSRYLIDDYNDGSAESSDIWEAAYRTPTKDEILYHADPMIHHPASRAQLPPYRHPLNVGNTNYPLLHPQPPNF